MSARTCTCTKAFSECETLNLSQTQSSSAMAKQTVALSQFYLAGINRRILSTNGTSILVPNPAKTLPLPMLLVHERSLNFDL